MIEQCLRDHEADLATDDLGLETCEGKKLLKAGALAKLELGLKSGPKLLFLLVTGMKRKLLHELPEHVTTAETAPWPEK
ncbi:MAG TPA: hypothetical protein VJV79_26290 [Polyangiaceae bacterium]|nr:hypothetical protein [Polyangiaceae bacterium]